MKGMISNKIDRESLKPGDHIYAYRLLHTYSHHGIYIGEDRVIHYNITQDANKCKKAKPYKKCDLDVNQVKGVVKSCVDCFLHGRHSLHRFRYQSSFLRYLANMPGTCTTGVADPPEVVISRANDCLLRAKDGFGEYDLFENNCEMFAVFCKTEKKVSIQACSAMLKLKAGVKMMRDRLLVDVKVHYGQEKHDKLEKLIDGWLVSFKSLKQLDATFREGPDSPGLEVILT